MFPFGFLMFLGGSKRNIWKKRVKDYVQYYERVKFQNLAIFPGTK